MNGGTTVKLSKGATQTGSVTIETAPPSGFDRFLLHLHAHTLRCRLNEGGSSVCAHMHCMYFATWLAVFNRRECKSGATHGPTCTAARCLESDSTYNLCSTHTYNATFAC